MNPITRQVQQIKESSLLDFMATMGQDLQRPTILLLRSFLVSFHMLGMLPVCLDLASHGSTNTHQNPSCSLHIAILTQVPQEEGTFLTFSKRGGEGGDSRGEEGLTLVSSSFVYLPDSVYQIICIQATTLADL